MPKIRLVRVLIVPGSARAIVRETVTAMALALADAGARNRNRPDPMAGNRAVGPPGASRLPDKSGNSPGLTPDVSLKPAK